MSIYIVDNDIRIGEYSIATEQMLKSLLTFNNPEYHKKVARGLWVGNTPEKICLWQRRDRDLIVPFGMLPALMRGRKPDDTFTNRIQPPELAQYNSTINLYDYQQIAVEKALKAKQGVIVAPCGAGKTMIGLAIAAAIGGRTLWLTHTQDLLRQSMERARSVYGLLPKDYGTITDGKIDIGSVITFATVQTMSKIDLVAVKNEWDVIIVDEAHHAVGSPTRLMMFYKVVSSLSARYKYGLTATPKRSDGLSPCMYALLGEKVHEIEREDVQDKVCPVRVQIKQTGYTPDTNEILEPDGTLNYIKLINEIIQDQERNEMIAQDAVKCAGTCLILTDRVEHVKVLTRMLNTLKTQSTGIYGIMSKKARSEALAALDCGKIKVLVATYSLAREGLDVPSLRNIIMATPQKNDTIITQSAGRVARQAQGKEYGTIIDYEDNFGMLRGWQKKREKIYIKLGYEVKWIAAKAAACGIDENDPAINLIWERWEQGEYPDAPELERR